MTAIPCHDERIYGFLEDLFRTANGSPWFVTFAPATRAVTTALPELGRQIARAAAGRSFALPVQRNRDVDRWIVAAVDARGLDTAVLRIERALVPSLAHFPSPTGAAVRNRFDPAQRPLHALGAELFPAGYYALQTRAVDRATVLQRLDRWARLEEEAPALAELDPPSHAELLERFRAATAASQWGEAERVLTELDRYGFGSAENQQFLRIEWLARQGRWSELWHAPDRPRTVRLRIPRGVRGALLTAYYETELGPAIARDGVAAAFAKYRGDRSHLSELLAGTFGLDHPGILVVKGFEEAASDHAERLAEIARQGDDAVRPILAELLTLCAPSEAPPLPTAEGRLRAALEEQDYDAALVYADELADPLARFAARTEIAALSNDLPLCADILRAYAELPPARAQALLAAFPTLYAHLDRVADVAGRSLGRVGVPAPPARWQVDDWMGWFAVALASADDEQAAHEALDRIDCSLERSFGDAWAQQLADIVVRAWVDGEHRGRRIVREALRRLVRALVADSQFPRDGLGADALYEAALEALLDGDVRNTETLLVLQALIETHLEHDPNRRAGLLHRVVAWLTPPVPALEARTLDLLELLIDYGAQPGQLVGILREWVDVLVSRPGQWDATRALSWRALVRWADAGADLVGALGQRLAAEEFDIATDPIAQLPAGFHVAIFSLNEQSAARAIALLRERNAGLRVTICADKVLTEQAKQLARGADLPVVVARCSKHALTEGIRPFLVRDPVYPPSPGATGIVQAIAAWAAQVEDGSREAA